MMSLDTPIFTEVRCLKCGKLLAKNGNSFSYEIKCMRCGTLNALMEKSSQQIIITDPEGIILYTNDAFEKTTGYSIGEAVGSKPSLWGGNMSKEFYEDLWDAIRNKKQSVMVTVRNKRKDGVFYDARLQISPIIDSNNEILFFVGVENPINNIKNKK